MTRRNPTYLYRAVSISTGYTIGRASGYLARSSAVEAGAATGAPFRIIRSEPIVFPTAAEAHDAAILRDRLRRIPGRTSREYRPYEGERDGRRGYLAHRMDAEDAL